MATTEQLLNRVNDSIDVLQEAQQTILEAKGLIEVAPTVAAEAKTIAQGAKTTADAAATQTALAEVKETADAALPKSGGEVMGALALQSPTFDWANPTTGRIAPAFSLVDKNLRQIFSLTASMDAANTEFIQILGRRPQPTSGEYYANLQLFLAADGTAYAIAPHPRSDNYGGDIVTMKAMKDYAPQKLTAIKNYYVGGANASDTADLFAGRGESPEKPFKTLDAAFHYIASHVISGGFTPQVVLQADIEWNSNYELSTNLYIAIKGDAPTRKLTLKSNLTMYSRTYISSLTLEGAGSSYLLFAFGASASLTIASGVTFTGAVEVGIVCNNAAVVNVAGAIAGNLTGKKYAVSTGGMIIGASKIPGTEAGTCDANSKAFG